MAVDCAEKGFLDCLCRVAGRWCLKSALVKWNWPWKNWKYRSGWRWTCGLWKIWSPQKSNLYNCANNLWICGLDDSCLEKKVDRKTPDSGSAWLKAKNYWSSGQGGWWCWGWERSSGCWPSSPPLASSSSTSYPAHTIKPLCWMRTTVSSLVKTLTLMASWLVPSFARILARKLLMFRLSGWVTYQPSNPSDASGRSQSMEVEYIIMMSCLSIKHLLKNLFSVSTLVCIKPEQEDRFIFTSIIFI